MNDRRVQPIVFRDILAEIVCVNDSLPVFFGKPVGVDGRLSASGQPDDDVHSSFTKNFPVKLAGFRIIASERHCLFISGIVDSIAVRKVERIIGLGQFVCQLDLRKAHDFFNGNSFSGM